MSPRIPGFFCSLCHFHSEIGEYAGKCEERTSEDGHLWCSMFSDAPEPDYRAFARAWKALAKRLRSDIDALVDLNRDAVQCVVDENNKYRAALEQVGCITQKNSTIGCTCAMYDFPRDQYCIVCAALATEGQ